VGKVIYYKDSLGKNPVSDFLDSLRESQQTKLLRVINYIKIYGLQSVIPHVKKVIGAPFWEIRILGKDNVRIFYVVIQGDVVLLPHGFTKKTQKTSSRDISVALKRLEEYRSRLTK